MKKKLNNFGKKIIEKFILKKILFPITIILIINSSAFTQEAWYFQTSPTNNNLNSVEFCWIWVGLIVGDNGTLLRTTDMGKNWINQSVTSEKLTTVEFIDCNTAWIVGGHGYIIKTTDAGSNWIQQTSGTTRLLTSIEFKNYNIGYAVGDSVILKTTNGGTNWIRLATPTGHRYFTTVHFVDSIRGYIADGSILETSNGGSTWTVVNPPWGANDFQTRSYGDLYTVGSYGKIYRGAADLYHWNWTWFNQQSGTIKDLDAIYFQNYIYGNWAGWIVGQNGTILKSVDNGYTWTSQISNTNKRLNSVYFNSGTYYGARLGWAVGENGTILSTVNTNDYDVGTTAIVNPVHDSIYAIDCNNFSVDPKVTIKNFGMNNQNSFFDVYFEIKQGNNTVYFNSRQDTISTGQTHIINFDPFTLSYDPDNIRDTYYVKTWTSLLSDSNHYNDTIKSSFKVIDPNYGYSDISGYYFLNSSVNANCIPDQPVFNWEDTTGSVNLISDGSLMVPFTEYDEYGYWQGFFRLTDALPVGNKFRFFGNNYDTILISTTGIIGLGGGSFSQRNYFNPVSIPSVSAPGPAIFPFWGYYNYFFVENPELNGDRSLKYKISGNKFIVTYDRFPLIYMDPENYSSNYISFQVILETKPDGETGNGNITVQFDDSMCDSLFLNNYYNGNLFYKIGIQNSSGTIGHQYPGPLFGSPLAVTFAQINSVLPVELAAFTSSVNDNNVTLLWQTSRETNNSGFDIERSSLENNWSKAGFVKCTGNSDEPKYYSFIDKNLTTGKYKYRLKQIDFNGSFEYFDLSGEVVIGVPEKYELSQNYPNPFNPVTNLEFGISELGYVSLKVYDVLGKEVKSLVNEIKQAGYYKVQFDGSSFSSGVYFYELRSGSFVSQKRMLLLK